MTTTHGGPSAGTWRAFQDSVDGDVLRPGMPGFDTAHAPAFGGGGTAVPLAVVRCHTTADVAEAVGLARRHRLPAVPRSGGHCFVRRSSTSGLLIDVGPMRAVAVDGDVVTVGAGARLGELAGALGTHGLALPAGCGPTVGVAGLTLGGGFGILGRSHGLMADRLLAARVVLADGRIVECDEHHDGDLFWALRGAGGGQFGIVTALTFRAVAAPDATAFHAVWPVAAAARMLDAWQHWSPSAPDRLAASLLLVAGPEPEEQPVVNLFGAMLDTEPATTAALERFAGVVGSDPVSCTAATRDYPETKRYLADLGARMGASIPAGLQASRSEFVARPLSSSAVEALIGHFTTDRTPGQTRELDLSPWGGAYARTPAAATAFAHRDASFLLKHAVAAPRGGDRAAAETWLDRSWGIAHPWGTGGVYPNFPDPRLTDGPRAYHGNNLERLRQVKSRYDADEFFRFPQSIRP
ncbi:FAD-binding oxidoreductase [Jiangella gansuensis]|uniref:FAD-binding oxidoreductase n=1 Tax=Jiangella gansuensis TaxID=281473 RepID=UPI0006851BF1|nr:FAD-binding oxidoreductase [Jiangella gansuensis]